MRISFAMILFLCSTMFAGQMLEFGPVNEVNDMVQSGDTLIVATGGGVVYYSLSSKETVKTDHSNDEFPDINITALFKSTDGTLWAGSKTGYLYHRNNRGRWSKFEDIHVVKSTINRIVAYREYLLVAHSSGITIFDPAKGMALSTSKTFASIEGSVREILVVADTLFAGVDTSLVRYDSLSTGLLKFSFRDSKSWKKEPYITNDNIGGLLYTKKGIDIYPRRVVQFGDTTVYGSVQLIKTDIGEDGKVTKYYQDFLKIVVNGVLIDSAIQKSAVTSVIHLSSGGFALGTQHEYIKLNPFKSDSSTILSGMVHGKFTRAMVSSSGDLWLTPSVWSGNEFSDYWRGINRYDGSNFHFYSQTLKGIGGFKQTYPVYGLTEGSDGTIWIGTPGASAKSWNPSAEVWSKWEIIGNKNSIVDTIFKLPEDKEAEWNKIDGITQDSSGLIWFSIWNNAVAKHSYKYRLAVLDPVSGKSKFLFSRLSENLDTKAAVNPFQCVVDSRGDRWFMGMGSDPFQESEAPLDDAIHIPFDVNPFKDSVEQLSEYIKSVSGVATLKQAVAAPNSGPVLLASAKGVGILRSGIKSIYMNGIQADTANIRDSWLNDFKKSSTSIAIESSAMELGGYFYDTKGNRISADSTCTTAFWAVLSGIGIERLVLRESFVDGVDYASLVFNSGERPVTISSEQFAFAQDAVLAIDHKRGVLWIASENGLGRYQLGMIPEEGNPDNKSGKMYPNPYSKSTHNGLVVDGLSSNSYIDVYTISGKLVAHLTKNEGAGFVSSGAGRILKWTPPSDIAPGTYIVALKDEENRTSLTTLRKLVIIP